MTSVLFSVWFRIQGIIQNTTAYYSGSGSAFSVLLKMSRVLFSVWFSIQLIIQGIVQNMTSVLFTVWFSNQCIIHGIIQNMTCVLFCVCFRIQGLFKIRPVYYLASGSGFSVLSCLRFQRT